MKQNDQILELKQNVVRLDRDGIIEKENVDIVTIKKRIVSLEIYVSIVKKKPPMSIESKLPLPSIYQL